MAANGTLRLVAANPEPISAKPIGVGATSANAKAALQTQINTLQTLLAQVPNNPALVSQIGAVLSAEDDWAAALNAESSAALQNVQNTLNSVMAQNAAQQTSIQTLEAQLKAAGITPAAPGKTPLTTTTPAPAASPGTFTTGQTAAATVFGAIAGWFGHTWYEEYRGKRS